MLGALQQVSWKLESDTCSSLQKLHLSPIQLVEDALAAEEEQIHQVTIINISNNEISVNFSPQLPVLFLASFDISFTENFQ